MKNFIPTLILLSSSLFVLTSAYAKNLIDGNKERWLSNAGLAFNKSSNYSEHDPIMITILAAPKYDPSTGQLKLFVNVLDDDFKNDNFKTNINFKDAYLFIDNALNPDITEAVAIGNLK